MALERLAAAAEGEGGVAAVEGAASAAGFRTVVRYRLDRLPPPARRILQIASVLDRAFTVEELGDLTGFPLGEISAVADDAVGTEVLVRTGALLTFRHPPTRESIATTLPAALRRSLRRQAVDVRLARGERARDVAAALAETAGPGDHEAVDLLREAATEIAAGAPAEAVALSRKALELSGPAGPHTAEIVGETVELLGRDGRYAEAESLADTALEGFLAPEAEARLRLRVARLVGRSSACEAVRHCRIGLSLPGLPEALRDRLSAVQALYLARVDDPVQAGPPGLTAAEAKVARLVAQGATNRQVAEQLSLSCHTVNSHLRHVFTKWDITSRVDLARLMLAREADPHRMPGRHDRRPRR